MGPSDAELAEAASMFFGGRARALHLMTCSSCTVDDCGVFIACAGVPPATLDASVRVIHLEKGGRR